MSQPNDSGQSCGPDRIAFYLPNLAGGGAERSTLRLAEAFAAQGYSVDLVVNQKRGPHLARLPSSIRVVALPRHSKTLARLALLRVCARDGPALLRAILLSRKPIIKLQYLRSLADYLMYEQPKVVVAALFQANLLAICARRMARSGTRIVVTARNTLANTVGERCARPGENRRWRQLPRLVHRLYPQADAIVAVSNGVADDLAVTARLDRATIQTIYNPVVSKELLRLAGEPLADAWFERDAPPVVLAAGRLEPQKDFLRLLEAFARTRQRRAARLVILGEGWQRRVLTEQAEKLGIAADVALPGWVDNPYAFMSRAAVFVLSSLWEGLPGVLIEAMACGCPAVATDCPSGPREILDNGRYGILVPVNDTSALAEALVDVLDSPPDDAIVRRRAGEFSVANGFKRYVNLIESVTANNDD